MSDFRGEPGYPPYPGGNPTPEADGTTLGPPGPKRWPILAAVAAAVVVALVVLAFVVPGSQSVRGTPIAQQGGGQNPAASGTNTPSSTKPAARGPVRDLPKTARLAYAALEDKNKRGLKKLRCAKTTERVDRMIQWLSEVRFVVGSGEAEQDVAQWASTLIEAHPPGKPGVDLSVVLRKVDSSWCFYDVIGALTVAGKEYGFPTAPSGFPYDAQPVVDDFLAKINSGDMAGAAEWSCGEPAELRPDLEELRADGNLRVDRSKPPKVESDVPVTGTRNGQTLEGSLSLSTDILGGTNAVCVLVGYAILTR